MLLPRDRALVAAASDLLRSRYVPEWHQVAAALRMKGGRVFRALNLDTQVSRCATCAEAVALGMARTEGLHDLDTIVAVHGTASGRARVVSPCGICREMLVDYGNPWIVHETRGRLVRSRASEMLPSPYGPRVPAPRPPTTARARRRRAGRRR